MTRRQLLPILVMLLAGACGSILLYVRRFPIIEFMWALLGILILFYIIGCGLRFMMDTFDEQIQKAQEEAYEEGNVIEKEVDDENEEIQI